MTYVITAGCVDILDKSCIEECPVDCIYEGDRMLYIQPEECVDCGACEPVCPQEAIYHEEDVPEELSAFVGGNRDFFAELGTPGGASRVGRSRAIFRWWRHYFPARARAPRKRPPSIKTAPHEPG